MIAGKHKGEKGNIILIDKVKGRVAVEGVAKVKRHTKAKNKSEAGVIVEREATINASNVMIFDAKSGKGTRIVMKKVDGKNVRSAVKSGKEL